MTSERPRGQQRWRAEAGCGAGVLPWCHSGLATALRWLAAVRSPWGTGRSTHPSMSGSRVIGQCALSWRLPSDGQAGFADCAVGRSRSAAGRALALGGPRPLADSNRQLRAASPHGSGAVKSCVGMIVRGRSPEPSPWGCAVSGRATAVASLQGRPCLTGRSTRVSWNPPCSQVRLVRSIPLVTAGFSQPAHFRTCRHERIERRVRPAEHRSCHLCQ